MALLQRLNDQWRLEKCNHVIVPYKGEIGAAQFSYGPSDIWTADGSLSSIKFCLNVFNSLWGLGRAKGGQRPRRLCEICFKRHFDTKTDFSCEDHDIYLWTADGSFSHISFFIMATPFLFDLLFVFTHSRRRGTEFVFQVFGLLLIPLSVEDFTPVPSTNDNQLRSSEFGRRSSLGMKTCESSSRLGVRATLFEINKV